MPGNAQIFKVGAQKGDRRHIAHQRMLGDNLADDVVGRQHFQYVEVFDDGGGEGAPALSRLGAAVASHLAMPRAEGEDPFQPVASRVLGPVSALRVQ